jgi:hypothetical protein
MRYAQAFGAVLVSFLLSGPARAQLYETPPKGAERPVSRGMPNRDREAVFPPSGPELGSHHGDASAHGACALLLGGYCLRRGPQGGYIFEDSRFTARISAQGALSFENHGPSFWGLGLLFDLTEMVLLSGGKDPYHYEKERFRKAVETFRIGLLERAAKEQSDAALKQLPQLLSRLWDNVRAKANRVQQVATLWREADPSTDEGRQARQIIRSFLGKRVPAAELEKVLRAR